jgi:hyperosmotically inducible periplasmic protein
MPYLSRHALRLGALAAALVTPFGLAACNKTVEQTVGQHVAGALAQATQELKPAGAQVAGSIKAGTMEAATTTRVNAALAADGKLSAMKIDVDTVGGRVTLSGTAPDADSRARAGVLASTVDGVVSVDNKLVVSGS